MHIAAQKGHLKVVEVLLAHGASAGVADNTGKTPLAFAEKNENDAIAALLRKTPQLRLDRAAYTGSTNLLRWTLHQAAHDGNMEVVKALVAEGADVNKRNKLNYTPLHYAAYSGHTEIAIYLREHGADVNSKDC